MGNRTDKVVVYLSGANGLFLSDDETPFPKQFDRVEAELVRRVESLRSAPRSSKATDARVVLEYLGGNGAPSVGTPATTSVVSSMPRVDRSSAIRAAGESEVEPFDPKDISDGRRRIEASLVQRQGQGKFRRAMLQAYGGRCAISSWRVEDVLEAAHIMPYRGEQTNHTTNGLLLRSDFHALFDLNLIEIDPDSFTVVVNSRLADTPYAEFHGQMLNLPDDVALRPSREALRERRKLPEPKP